MPLPTKQPDPHANVEVHDYSTAGQMSMKDMLTMKSIASSRGETNAAMKWGSLAAERQRVDENQAAMDKQFDAFKPRRQVSHGGQIVDTASKEPWGQDREHLRLAAELVNVEARIKATPKSQDAALLQLQNRKADLADEMKERETAITDGLKEMGVWTDADERTLAAEKSLASKAAQVQAQVRGA